MWKMFLENVDEKFQTVSTGTYIVLQKSPAEQRDRPLCQTLLASWPMARLYISNLRVKT